MSQAFAAVTITHTALPKARPVLRCAGVDSTHSGVVPPERLAERAGCTILANPVATGCQQRVLILAFDPVEAAVFDSVTTRCTFDQLALRAQTYTGLEQPVSTSLFPGGWMGFLTYEAGLSIEGISPTTRADVPLPAARFALYDTWAMFDHEEESWQLYAIDWPVGVMDDRPPSRDRLAALRAIIDGANPRELKFAARTENARSRRLKPAARGEVTGTQLIPNMSRDDYLRRVERAKRYIEAGDIYQVNLSMRFTARTTASPGQLYQRLCEVNPAAYSAFIQWGDTAIISASPELFLELRDGRVITRPIKGTRPRTGDPIADAIAQRELVESEKERAELNMIVDLLRNDLGRVCEFGSIRVTDPGRMEEHPTVYHRVATIEGRLARGKDWSDLLRATFPGGSITGAPKIRAMQIIDELEPTARGVYCGSIGWIGLDGSMCMNIAIRTMVQIGDTVHLYAGSGIVADSDPEQEYEEIMAKAEGMIRALNAHPACR